MIGQEVVAQPDRVRRFSRLLRVEHREYFYVRSTHEKQRFGLSLTHYKAKCRTHSSSASMPVTVYQSREKTYGSTVRPLTTATDSVTSRCEWVRTLLQATC